MARYGIFDKMLESVFGIGDTIKYKNKSGNIRSGEIKAINFEGCKYPDDYNFNLTEVKQNQIIINI